MHPSSPSLPSGQIQAPSVLTIRLAGRDVRPTPAQAPVLATLSQITNRGELGSVTYSERAGGLIGVTNQDVGLSTYVLPNGHVLFDLAQPDATLSSAGAVEDTSMATTQQGAVNRSPAEFIDAWMRAPLADCLTPVELQQVRSDILIARCQQHQPADLIVYQAEVNGYLDLLFKQKLESFVPTDASQPTDIAEQVKAAVLKLLK